MEALTNSETHDPEPAMIGGWRPITNAEWAAYNPDGCWPAGEICFEFPIPYMLPEIGRRQLHVSARKLTGHRS